MSNGNQTGPVFDALHKGSGMEDILKDYRYEPDTPNFTPRITGICSLRARTPMISLSVLRKSPWDEECQRFYFHYYSVGPGFGYGVTTYSGDSNGGDPLPAFTGEPRLLPIGGGIDEIAQAYWGYLNESNRISLAVKAIDLSAGSSKVKIINKYVRVKV
jgi:hypothetical protein